MSKLNLDERRRIAAAVRSFRNRAAEASTNEFLVLHPDWLTRYGDRARQFGIEDAGYHLDFLAAAIECGGVEAFRQYCVWAARMLMARKIEPRFLALSLDLIARALRQRLPAADLEIVDACIRSGMESSLETLPDAGAGPAGPLQPVAEMYTTAALASSRQAALNIVLEAFRQGRSIVDLYDGVLQASLYRIGGLWEANRITVAKEHMATAITQYVIAQLYRLIDLPERSRGNIVITGPVGESHQIGANMVADVLEASGWDVRFLGTNTPVNGVLDAIEEHQADILGISATMLLSVPQVMHLVNSVRRKPGSRVRVIIGGAAFRPAPMLYREIGADGCCVDLRSAIELVDRLGTPQPHF